MKLFIYFIRLLMLVFYAMCLNPPSYMVLGTTREYFDAKYRLVKYLTSDSETVKEILPAHDINTTVNVKIRIQLRQIATVDEKNQAVRLTVWLRFDWNNPFLTWDPANYSGIESVHASNEFFWIPDVALFNEASLEEEIEILYKRLATKLVIHKDGNCTWNAPATLLSQCKIDVANFPFDEQICNVTIGSWTYSGEKINLTYFEKEVNMENFIKNGEWLVESATLKDNVKLYGPEKTPYPDVTLTLKIKRRSLYYGLNIVIPCALIAVLALFSFLLPSDHGERMSLVVTVLLALSVYMLIISDSLPETSDAVPVLGIYCLGIVVTVALCLFSTCLTLKFRDMTTPMPRWLEVIVINMARIVFVKFHEPSPASSSDKISLSLTNEKFTRIPDGKAETANCQETNMDDNGLLGINEKHSKSFEDALLDEVRLLTEELRSKQEEEAFAKKWKIAAKVFDRFFLLIFSLVYICLVSYLLSAM
ncbi:neuronal acetylcholine receptor subunit alpha-9-like [Dendronephthya gigantea]|uniref:neuronal acetylcholine receptor subunit alpha-9-like n=1 Tax=Dendronephthya gigantea TaxID=151771 RepID=UPI00106AEAD5|nr:neuronal acetylcholine receptor subunit alpha-9-like [Dendronephthya gigantea]XP_028410152.1 neuronal acetylcholine receptor subunit alpha-9-like [Dendronephthya gigantea]